MSAMTSNDRPDRSYRAAGGVVFDEQGRVLLIERDIERNGETVHEVRLPKGKLDPGERDADAAVRETGEETGYWRLEVVGDLGEFHTRYLDPKGRDTARDERWFVMRLTDPTFEGQQMIDGSDEALFEPTWAKDLADAAARMTYQSEREVIAAAIRWREANP